MGRGPAALGIECSQSLKFKGGPWPRSLGNTDRQTCNAHVFLRGTELQHQAEDNTHQVADMAPGVHQPLAVTGHWPGPHQHGPLALPPRALSLPQKSSWAWSFQAMTGARVADGQQMPALIMPPALANLKAYHSSMQAHKHDSCT